VTLDERIKDIEMEILGIMMNVDKVSINIDELERDWENRLKCKQANTTEVSEKITKMENQLVRYVRTCAKRLHEEVQHEEAVFMKSYKKAKQEIKLVRKQIESSESDVRVWLKRRIPQEMYSQEEEMKQKLNQAAAMCDLPRPAWNMLTLDQPQVDIEAEISKLFGTLKKKTVKYGKPSLLRTIKVKTPEDKNECILGDVAFLNDGNIAVNDADNANVKVFTTEGELVLQSKKSLKEGDEVEHEPVGDGVYNIRRGCYLSS
jgi:hypothetical protein